MRDTATPSIPRIEPVPEGITRPLWSVMIPNYNSGEYLRKTLLRLPLELPTWCIFAAGYVRRLVLERFAGKRYIPKPRLGAVEAPPVHQQRHAA